MARQSNQNNKGCAGALLFYFACLLIIILVIKHLGS